MIRVRPHDNMYKVSRMSRGYLYIRRPYNDAVQREVARIGYCTIPWILVVMELYRTIDEVIVSVHEHPSESIYKRSQKLTLENRRCR